MLEPFVATSVVCLDCFSVVTDPAKMVVPSQGLEPIAVPSVSFIVGVHGDPQRNGGSLVGSVKRVLIFMKSKQSFGSLR